MATYHQSSLQAWRQSEGFVLGGEPPEPLQAYGSVVHNALEMALEVAEREILADGRA